MPNAATADSGKTTKSLIDKLNAALASGADERRRILEHVADLFFAAGARGHSSERVALFDGVLQKLCTDMK